MTEPALGPRMFGAQADPYAGPHPYAGGGQPAAGQQAYPPHPFAGHRDFEEVDAHTYRERAAAQPQPGQQAPVHVGPPVERPRDPVGQHLADVRAEVIVEQQRAAQAEDDPDPIYPDGAIAVPLVTPQGRFVVHVLDPQDWPSDANSSMHIGDYESWADGCLAGDDYDKVWRIAQPRMRDVGAMMDALREINGQDSGKSLSSPRSFRNAAKR
jgi:hypothetical protein